MHKTKISECKQLRIYVPEPKGNVVYLHGFTSRFENHLKNLKNLKDYNVFAINIPGHGESPFKDESELNSEAFAHFYKEFIEELKLDKVILYGISMGGGIAIILQSLLPKDMVEKIILVNPCSRKKDFDPQEYLTNQNANDISKMIPESIEDSKEIVNRLFYDAKSFFKTQENYDLYLNDYYKSLANLKHLKSMLDLKLRARIGKLNSQSIQKIQAPTLLIVGENDKLVPSEKTIENFKDHPHVKTIIIPKTGHMPHLENPFVYWSQIFDFLNK
ncbi:ESTERASE/LIPASE 1 [Mycoplasmopsis pulmonis]|uniref:ESTERASE/LIPASE 1 n=1 Tax=Mycoplasmopsis pulmonis (strain UAB CTIP) TaxID=272635 RepID=Q98RH2_MYCPU|nr:alpha/beta hydrolase [Mycoplasmopsis pulmonis]MDZ7293771.1 alpha/beta hydrolase [Mycoplasmopsis pulmonis]CAC13210.1 ESTERASE/LIPASE 1 [Mycoplasmopsis pulmonis]VEU67829.1 putative esterase/lipase [Mycoplasmopsis pulmonis]